LIDSIIYEILSGSSKLSIGNY